MVSAYQLETLNHGKINAGGDIYGTDVEIGNISMPLGVFCGFAAGLSETDGNGFFKVPTDKGEVAGFCRAVGDQKFVALGQYQIPVKDFIKFRNYVFGEGNEGWGSSPPSCVTEAMKRIGECAKKYRMQKASANMKDTCD